MIRGKPIDSVCCLGYEVANMSVTYFPSLMALRFVAIPRLIDDSPRRCMAQQLLSAYSVLTERFHFSLLPRLFPPVYF